MGVARVIPEDDKDDSGIVGPDENGAEQGDDAEPGIDGNDNGAQLGLE
jgi:hypothetical protein